MKMASTITVLLTIMTMTSMLAFMISKKSTMDRSKSSPFECGFSAMSTSRLPFSIHFFMIAIIFLVFDIEMVLILPIVSSTKMLNTKEWMSASIIISSMISYGLYHEWMNGIIEWSK